MRRKMGEGRAGEQERERERRERVYPVLNGKRIDEGWRGEGVD